MKKTLNRVKNYVHDHEEVAFFGSFAVIVTAACIAVVKVAEIEQKNLQSARESGATVVETPFGNVIVSK